MARIKKTLSAKGKNGSASSSSGWKVALYIRLSREDGNIESESVINQKKILQIYMDKEFEGEYSIVDFYVDDGLTGTDDARKDFMRLNYDVEQGNVNCIVVKTLARCFRNYSDQGYYLEYYYPLHKTRFISLGEPKVDTYKNPEAITGLEVPITGLMNDRFAATTSHNVRRTFKMKRERGEFIGSFAPYGFMKDPRNKNNLILDPEIVPIKHDMKDWVLRDGMSLGSIARKLNELQIPNPTAYKKRKGLTYCNPHAAMNDGLWVATTVRRTLLNEANIGNMVQGRFRIMSYKVHEQERVPEEEWFIVENAIEPTFSKEEYEALKRILERDTRTPKGKNSIFLFGGFLRCADCKKAMQRKTSKDKTYYICRTYSEKSKTACTRHSIREDELEKAVLSALRAHIELLEPLAAIVNEINQKPKASTSSARIIKMKAEREKEMAKTKAMADGLYEDMKNDLITLDDYKRLKVKYQEKVEQCAVAIQNLEEEQRKADEGVTTANDVFQTFLKYRNIQSLDRAILSETIEQVLIHEGKTISVVMRFENELERVVEFVAANRD